ncbi:MarR family winged helix-turn-helix transcriptional regulator [Variovorax sp. GB4P3]
MNDIDALDFCLTLRRAHAQLDLRLDQDLGAFHGLNFSDFTLLHLLLGAHDTRLPLDRLAHTLGLPMSALIRRMVLLEKTGLAERVAGPGADPRRHAALRPGGRQLVQGAVATVEAHCREALRPIAAERLQGARQVLRALCGDNALHA